MTNINKTIAIHKMMNLKSALEECGIEADFAKMEDGSILLTAMLWNCYDGSEVEFTVYADAAADFENIEHYADTHEHDADILAMLDEVAEEN